MVLIKLPLTIHFGYTEKVRSEKDANHKIWSPFDVKKWSFPHFIIFLAVKRIIRIALSSHLKAFWHWILRTIKKVKLYYQWDRKMMLFPKCFLFFVRTFEKLDLSLNKSRKEEKHIWGERLLLFFNEKQLEDGFKASLLARRYLWRDNKQKYLAFLKTNKKQGSHFDHLTNSLWYTSTMISKQRIDDIYTVYEKLYLLRQALHCQS